MLLLLASSSQPSLVQSFSASRYYAGPRSARVVCYCFSICTEAEAEDFLARLPTVHSATSSPAWYGYLREVYGDGLSLPFNVASLQVFYSALLPPLRMGSRCGKTLPLCNISHAACSEWATMNHLGRSAHHQRKLSNETTVTFAWENTPGEAIFIVSGAAQPTADNGWVEVSRRTAHVMGGHNRCAGEGAGYGCWFSLVRGTGVFVNVGRSWRIIDLQGPDSSSHSTKDCTFAAAVVRKGFDSVQFISADDRRGSELLVTTPSCMEQPHWLVGPCVPLPLRRASSNGAATCVCNNSFAWMNCAGCRADYPLAMPRLPWSSVMRLWDMVNGTMVLSGGTGTGTSYGYPEPHDLSMLSGNVRADTERSEAHCGLDNVLPPNLGNLSAIAARDQKSHMLRRPATSAI